MAKQFDRLAAAHVRFIEDQHIYFTGTAATTGRVNISPKGMDSLRVMSPNRILWLSVTGSGNETAAHLADDPRMTLMWCAFSAQPLILRAYGTASVTHRGAAGWAGLAAHFPEIPGARQIYDLAIDLVQTSCGYAVPFMDFVEDRTTLRDWAARKGDEGLADYWAEKNRSSIDGKPTGIEAAISARSA